MTTSPIERAAESFAAELAQWRGERGLSKKQLASRMGFDPSYISHIEGRRHRPTEDFARRAEAVLGSGGAIWRRYQEYDELRHARAAGSHRDPPVPEQWLPPGTGLIVEREIATLSYLDGSYRCAIRRDLYNAGTEPVTRYLVRINVDRYPHNPTQSNLYHRAHPLTFAELDLRAYCGEPVPRGHADAREPMEWRAKYDRDTFKEVWLHFENPRERFPLYPGQRTTIEYAYTVSPEKWGQWFQRAVRLPTRRLTVRLEFPTALDPQVWGVETSLSAEEMPLRTPLERDTEDGRVRFEWSTEEPPLNARYRLEWRFRAAALPAVPAARTEMSLPRASDLMRRAGIVQRGSGSADESGASGLLRQRAQRFELPRDVPLAREVVGRLRDTLDRLEELHVFGKGVGLAAPQIGLPWAAAVVRPPDRSAGPVVLLNPVVRAASTDFDERYEGCLSFFDQRGLVVRPLMLEVLHVGWDGGREVVTFEQAMARLVAHEIDHLEGRLYVDRMAPGVPLLPVSMYGGTGRPWEY